MKLPQDEVFRHQWRALRLRFTCEHCAHFDGDACIYGFPTDEHREQRYLNDSAAPLVFCKDFELT